MGKTLVKSEKQSLRKYIFEATSIVFMFQLFGAVGNGIITFIGNILKTDYAGTIWESLLHISYWATELFFIAFVVILVYKITGLPSIAPALVLSIYFSHFAGLYSGEMTFGAYTPFLPYSLPGGINIGYMGYLVLALLIGYSIKYSMVWWKRASKAMTPGMNKIFKATIQRIPALKDVDGVVAVDALTFVMHILLIPILCAYAIFFMVYYGIGVPFNALGDLLGGLLPSLFEQSNALGGLLMGVMVGFDTTGPVATEAFKYAADMTAAGNAVPMTIYTACFVMIGWVVFTGFMLGKVMKKGGKLDKDDGNLAITGPVNAFFMNMRLTVSTGMSMAYRRPIATIVSNFIACTLVGVFCGLVGISNADYIAPEAVQAFQAGDMYTTIKQPHMMLSSTKGGGWMLLILAVCAIIGGLIFVFFAQRGEKRRIRKGVEELPDTDIIDTLRLRYGYVHEENSKEVAEENE